MWIDMKVGFPKDMVIIEPKGRLTLETEAQFTEAARELLQSGVIRLVLNLEYVPYIDSAGLGAIVAAYTSACRRGGTLKLLRPTRRSRKVLGITKLLTVLESYDTEEEVLRSFESRDAKTMAC
jgi:anti-sigma B factor antagonist